MDDNDPSHGYNSNGGPTPDGYHTNGRPYYGLRHRRYLPEVIIDSGEFYSGLNAKYRSEIDTIEKYLYCLNRLKKRGLTMDTTAEEFDCKGLLKQYMKIAAKYPKLGLESISSDRESIRKILDTMRYYMNVKKKIPHLQRYGWAFNLEPREPREPREPNNSATRRRRKNRRNTRRNLKF